MNGITVLHKRPDEISQILVGIAYLQGGRSSETQSRGPPRARANLPPLPSLCEDGTSKMVSSSPASPLPAFSSACPSSSFTSGLMPGNPSKPWIYPSPADFQSPSRQFRERKGFSTCAWLLLAWKKGKVLYNSEKIGGLKTRTHDSLFWDR